MTVYNGDGQVVVRGSDGELKIVPAPAARLVVSPEKLSLWKGETGKLTSVSVDPGGGKAPHARRIQAGSPGGSGDGGGRRQTACAALHPAQPR